MKARKNVVIHEEEFSAITILKPYSEEYLNQLYVVNEDAHGEFYGELITKSDLKKRLKFSDKNFKELLNQL